MLPMLYPPVKKPIELEAVWALGPVWTLYRTEKFPATAGNRTTDCPAPRLVATLTTVHQLHEEYRTLVLCPHFFPFALQQLLGPYSVFCKFRTIKRKSVFSHITLPLLSSCVGLHHITSPPGSDWSPTSSPAAA
jgi:hypothetical protein